MIEIVKQDIIDGEILDTQVKIEYEITVAGEHFEQFKYELEELISRFRI
jgi:hypothetical protein